MKNIRLVILLGILSIVATSKAQEENYYHNLFLNANELYKQGEYQKAQESYLEIVNADLESAALYYNIANTYFQNKQTAMAIYYYEKALKLAPKDQDILFNLELANAQIIDKIEALPESFLAKTWSEIVYFFSIEFYSLFTILMAFLTFGSVILFFLSKIKILKKIAFYSFFLVFALMNLSYLAAQSQKNHRISNDQGIVIQPVVSIKNAPSINATELFIIHEGLKVNILDEEDAWVRIKLSDGNLGWMPKSYLLAF